MSTLLCAAAELSEQPFCSLEAHLNAKSDAFKLRDGAWQQLACIEGMNLVKRRQRKTLCKSGLAFELLAAGRERARELRSKGESREALPLRSHLRVIHGERSVTAPISLADD